MSKFLKSAVFTLGILVIGSGFCAADVSEETEVQIAEEFSAPNYDKLIPIRHWSRQSGDVATTIGEWKRWWTYLGMKKTVIMQWVNGLKLRIYPGNEVFRALFVRGIYEPNVVTVINSLLPKNGVLIDIGSNMGYCSLLASDIVGEEGKVFAIEPSERDFLRLLDNININKLRQINSYRLAILDYTGEANISIASEERSALNTIGAEFSYKGIEKIRTEKVPCTTVDAFVKEEALDKIDVIKMDVEGSELKVLKGAHDSIEKYRPALILGLNENALKVCGATIEEIEREIFSLRYKAYELEDTPVFAFKEVKNLKQCKGKMVVCLHESLVPPSSLPQPEDKEISTRIKEFFAR